MIFAGTRGGKKANFSQALLKCLPDDGGVFALKHGEDLRREFRLMDSAFSFKSISAMLFTALVKDEISASVCEAICDRSFSFAPELRQLDKRLFLLDLTTGPTGSSRDFGLFFLISCLEKILAIRGERRQILAATTSAQGASIAQALRGSKNLRATILYPAGKTFGLESCDLQENGGNVCPVEVEGDFSDLCKMIEKVFSIEDFAQNKKLTFANSSNIARILPLGFPFAFAFSRLKSADFCDLAFAFPAKRLETLAGALMMWQCGLPTKGFVTESSARLSEKIDGGCVIPDSILPFERRVPANPALPENVERIEESFEAQSDLIRAVVFPAKVSSAEEGDAMRKMVKMFGFAPDVNTAAAFCTLEKKREIAQKMLCSAVLIAEENPAINEQKVKAECGFCSQLPERLQFLRRDFKCKNKIPADFEKIIPFLK